jgi:hypothetical protein
MTFFDLRILCQTRGNRIATVITGGADANESAKRQANCGGINRYRMFLDNAGAFQSPNAFIDSRRGEVGTLPDFGIGRARVFSEEG